MGNLLFDELNNQNFKTFAAKYYTNKRKKGNLKEGYP